MRNLLLGYRDNMRVEIEPGVPVTAKTVADLRALPTWPDGMVLNIHIDLDPRLSIVRVERASCPNGRCQTFTGSPTSCYCECSEKQNYCFWDFGHQVISGVDKNSFDGRD